MKGRFIQNGAKKGFVVGAIEKAEQTVLKKLTYWQFKHVSDVRKESILKFFIVCNAFILLIMFTQMMFSHEDSKNDYDEYIKQHMLPIGTATDKDYYITRPNGRDDGGVVRVMFVIASNRTDQTLCYAVASAYFTNIPVIVTGYNVKDFKLITKPSMFMSALERADMEDSDVVIALDSDIMFTGLDYLPFVDKFIKLSPANLNELDAKAVRTGEALPPVLYGSEGGCWYPQTLADWEEYCIEVCSMYERAHHRYENTLIGSIKPFFNYVHNNLKFLNTGSSIQRVWAMRKVFAAFLKFMANNDPLVDKEWWEDQSVFAKLYLELRLWEIEEDYFRKHTNELRTMSNEYGLYAGMIGIDLRNELSATVWHGKKDQDFELITDLWLSNISERLIVKSYNDSNVSTFVEHLYNFSNIKELFSERMLTRSYSNVHSVTIAPPLLSIVPRHINGKDKPAERVYPWIAHYAGKRKLERYENALSYMQWSLPMMFDEEEWKRGKQYAMSMPIELWTGNDDKLRLRYGDVCEKHPFNKMKWK